MDFSAAETLQPAHGQKRPPDNELENEQRLAKRFNLLNLGTNVIYRLENNALTLR